MKQKSKTTEEYIVFIDESGDQNLDMENINPQYPIFVLVAVVFKKNTPMNSLNT